jgi:uncharacterized protein YndB with AHSA1/START domain
MVTGQTKDAGFEIGVSKTLTHAPGTVWEFLTGPKGVALWLGAGAILKPVKGSVYRTDDGAQGEVRSFHEGSRIRLTCRPAGWDHDTTVQVTVTPSGAKTLLRFHQEWLADAAERRRQRAHWQAVMAAVERGLGGE